MAEPTFQDEDYAGSDDMEEILEYSKNIQRIQEEETRVRVQPIEAPDRDLRTKIAEKEAEVHQYDEDILQLTRARGRAAAQLEDMKMHLRNRNQNRASASGGNATDGIDYQADTFDWDEALLDASKKYFDIGGFRLCQRGVCNANMDGRDIVCVMPTGGGKSLTYQLPALLSPGCTFVISPLISLIEDQVMNLSGHGIDAVMLLGTTKINEKQAIFQRLRDMAAGKGRNQKEIKLCYITPEKLAKDKNFFNILHQLSSAGKLARFVIDEAHCVSTYGHDFRPAYNDLHILKTSFPNIPTMALTATCPPKVLEDLVKVLRLPRIVGGQNANTDGTVYFSAPLYRKNLMYKILPKPPKGEDAYKEIVNWILTHHPNDSGIIYCFKKNDSQLCAEKVQELSDGKIRTGTYHSEIGDEQKHQIHEAWREGRVQVVCATIAFGLGIDKGNVRFVIHHSLSKSLDGYYQESGRAGRDGKDADCILYYRPQDATLLSGMVFRDNEGLSKLRDILGFVEDVKECRKIQFANYFSQSWNLSINSWTTEESDALEACGHCDNCTRDPESIVEKDVTLAAWQLVRIVAEAQKIDARLTMNMLATTARKKKGTVARVDVAKGKGKMKTKESAAIDLDCVCGGPVDLSSQEIEHLIVQLVMKEYLREKFMTGTYSTNVYIDTGVQAATYTRHTREHVLEGAAGIRKIDISYVKRVKAKPKKSAPWAPMKKGAGAGAGGPAPTLPKKRTAADLKGKGRAVEPDLEGGSDSGEYIDPDEGLEGHISTDSEVGDDPGPSRPPPPATPPTAAATPAVPTVREPPPSQPDTPPRPAMPQRVKYKVPRSAAAAPMSKKPPLPAASRVPSGFGESRGKAPVKTTPRRGRSGVKGAAAAIAKSTVEVISVSDSEYGEGDLDDDSDDSDGDGVGDVLWLFNQRGAPPRKKARKAAPVAGSSRGKTAGRGQNGAVGEVITLSD